MAGMFDHDPSKKLAMLGAGLHAIGLAAVLATAGIGYALVLRPLDARIDELDGRSQQLQASLQNAHVVRAQAQRLRGAVAAMEAKSAELQKRVPDEPLEGEFLSQLTQAAGQAGLKIGDYRPGVVRTGEKCSQMAVQLSCQGPYRSICDFLDRLSALPRLTQVEKLDVSASGPDGCPVSLSLVVYFRLTKTPAAQAAKGGQVNG
jgi:Tfp pilus assembly protein PilO